MYQTWHLPLEACCTMPRCSVCKYFHHFLFRNKIHKLMFAFMLDFILFQVILHSTKRGWHFIELFVRDISPFCHDEILIQKYGCMMVICTISSNPWWVLVLPWKWKKNTFIHTLIVCYVIDLFVSQFVLLTIVCLRLGMWMKLYTPFLLLGVGEREYFSLGLLECWIWSCAITECWTILVKLQ